MPRLSRFAVFALLLLPACGPKSQVLPEEAVEFRRFRHVGCAPFTDRGGRGDEIALAVEAALQGAMYDPVDHKALVDVLMKYKPDRDRGLSLEALEFLRSRAGADAVIFGRMAQDWSFASVQMVEADVGDPVLHVLLRPRKAKTFAKPEDVALEFLRVYSKLK